MHGSGGRLLSLPSTSQHKPKVGIILSLICLETDALNHPAMVLSVLATCYCLRLNSGNTTFHVPIEAHFFLH